MIKRLKRLPRSIRLKGRIIEYSFIVSSKRRTISIEINTNAKVNVYAPRFVPEKTVQKFIVQKSDWIIQKIGKMHHYEKAHDTRTFDGNGRFLFLGRYYAMNTQESQYHRPRVTFDGSRFFAITPVALSGKDREQALKKELEKWYRLQAKEILAARMFHYARIMKLRPLNISIRGQKSIWGSCHHRRKSVNLNWKLILSPIDTIDYVIVHELAHLKVPRHSRRFWATVAGILPDYKRRQRWLKVNALNMKWV